MDKPEEHSGTDIDSVERTLYISSHLDSLAKTRHHSGTSKD